MACTKHRTCNIKFFNMVNIQCEILAVDSPPAPYEKRRKILKFLKKRMVIVKEWSLSVAQAPIGYIWLPISCCFKNPMGYLTNRETVKREMIKPNSTALDNFALNFAMLFEGVITILSGLWCCCGCFTVCSPEDVYDR